MLQLHQPYTNTNYAILNIYKTRSFTLKNLNLGCISDIKFPFSELVRDESIRRVTGVILEIISNWSQSYHITWTDGPTQQSNTNYTECLHRPGLIVFCCGGVAALSSDIWRNVKSETWSSNQWERLISGGGGTGPMPVFYPVIKLNQRKLRRNLCDLISHMKMLEALSGHQHRVVTRSPWDQHCNVTGNSLVL